MLRETMISDSASYNALYDIMLRNKSSFSRFRIGSRNYNYTDYTYNMIPFFLHFCKRF